MWRISWLIAPFKLTERRAKRLMTFQVERIRDERLSEKAIHQLLMLIRSGQIPVGGKLPAENLLSEQLGISRGILREALTVLEVRGFVRRAPREGTTIIRTQEDNLGEGLAIELKKAAWMDLLDFRETMECKVVELVIQRASDEELEALSSLLEHTDMEESSKDYYFHYRLALLSGNSLFVSFIDTYYGLIKEIRDMSFQVHRRREQIKKEHQRIVLALEKRDKFAARRAVKAHLKAVNKLINEEL